VRVCPQPLRQGSPKFLRTLSKRIALGADRVGFSNARTVRNEVELIEKRQNERLGELKRRRLREAHETGAKPPEGALEGEWLTMAELSHLTKEDILGPRRNFEQIDALKDVAIPVVRMQIAYFEKRFKRGQSRPPELSH
jgi:hypothetical protein